MVGSENEGCIFVAVKICHELLCVSDNVVNDPDVGHVFLEYAIGSVIK